MLRALLAIASVATTKIPSTVFSPFVNETAPRILRYARFIQRASGNCQKRSSKQNIGSAYRVSRDEVKPIVLGHAAWLSAGRALGAAAPRGRRGVVMDGGTVPKRVKKLP